MENVEEIHEKTDRWQIKSQMEIKRCSKEKSFDYKQMFGDDGKNKRYQIIKRLGVVTYIKM